jgi:hypothetical protein
MDIHEQYTQLKHYAFAPTVGGARNPLDLPDNDERTLA